MHGPGYERFNLSFNRVDIRLGEKYLPAGFDNLPAAFQEVTGGGAEIADLVFQGQDTPVSGNHGKAGIARRMVGHRGY